MQTLRRIAGFLDRLERRVRQSFGRDISTPLGRLTGRIHYHLFDHAFLRVFWSNFEEIAPGVYRSNQPTHRRFEKYARMGIRTIVNLRGEEVWAHHLFEKESCERLGLKLVNAKLWARSAPPAQNLLAVIEALRTAERPVLFHCKSGADRAGIVAAIYLIVFEGKSVAEARRMLGLRYVHLKFTRTGVQDYLLDVYEARLARGEIGFEDWLRTEYAPKRIQQGFDERIPPARVAEELAR